MAAQMDTVDVRPYQLMCISCRLGAEGPCDYYFARRLDEVLAAVREDPNRPVRLRSNVDTVYAYQNPGREYDTPEGDLFNDKRDLDILQKLGLVPGDARPALEVFNRVFNLIPTCRGICGYGDVTSEDWRGCRLAESGNYERGHALGVSAVIPARDPGEKAAAKKASCAEIYSSDALRIRPHHLMCMTCFHKGREAPEPIEADNLFEVIDAIQRNPDIPVELVPGPCMICPPCGKYDPRNNWCVGGVGTGLRDQKKDLDTLQILGLRFGDRLPARELLNRVFDRSPSPRDVCAYGDRAERAPEWSLCGGAKGSPDYAKGRAVGLGVPGVRTRPEAEESDSD